jgi:hypothetical protein
LSLEVLPEYLALPRKNESEKEEVEVEVAECCGLMRICLVSKEGDEATAVAARSLWMRISSVLSN